MGGLTEFLRELTALLLLASVGELLVPRGKLSSVIHLVLGLAVIAVMLEALPADPFVLPELSAERRLSEERILEQGEALSRRLSNEAADVYENELAAAAEQTALKISGLTGAEAQVSVEDDGTVRDAELTLYGDAAVMGAAVEAVGELLGISADMICWHNGGETVYGE